MKGSGEGGGGGEGRCKTGQSTTHRFQEVIDGKVKILHIRTWLIFRFIPNNSQEPVQPSKIKHVLTCGLQLNYDKYLTKEFDFEIANFCYKKNTQVINFLYKTTTAKSCCFTQDKNININDKTAKTKAICGFPILRTDKPSFFRGFNEESESPYNSKSIDEQQLEI